MNIHKASLLCLLFTISARICFAQPHEGIPYQAVLNSGTSSVSHTIDVRFGLYSDGSLLYEEEHQTTPHANGLFNLVIGQGAVTAGSWNALDWAEPVDLSVDVNIGGDWDHFGSTLLQSVPKSFYALRAGTVDNLSITELTDVNTTSIPEPGFTLKWNGSHWIPGTDNVRDEDFEIDNELQQLSLEGNVLSLSRQGGQILLPGATETFTATDSSLYYLGDLVGIGTEFPQARFHVSGDILVAPDSLSAGSQMRWNMDKGAFRAGILESGSESFWNGQLVGEGSFAVNHSTKATGQYSSAIGDQTQANGKNSFAGGLASLANGDGAFSFGYTNYATGIRSVTFGQSNLSTGAFSVSAGTGTQANGHASVAMGEGVLTESMNAAAFGTYNSGSGLRAQWRDTDPIFEIGNGRNALHRSNALLVLKNGRTAISPGIASPASQLHVFQQSDSIGGGIRLSSGSAGYWEFVARADGHLAFYRDGHLLSTIDPTTGAWVQLSDVQVKEDIQPMTAGLDELLQLSPVTYHYVFEEEGRETYGLIAQEVERIFPDLVISHGNLKGLSYQEFSILAIKAIQEQHDLIQSQQTRIEDLEARMKALESAILK